MTDDPNNWAPDATVGSWEIRRTGGPDDGLKAEDFVVSIKALADKAKALVDSVSHDNNGSMVGGQFMGGHGGLLSRETIKAADALRLELDKW